MSTNLQSVFADHQYKNWQKAGLSLKYAKQGIMKFVKEDIEKFHKKVMKLIAGSRCNSCQIIQTKGVFTIRCPNSVCDKIFTAISNEHRFQPAWKNTDCQMWCRDSWQLAKCFMSLGYAKVSEVDTDLPGLLNVIINNRRFEHLVNDNMGNNSNIFCQARDVRNSILHNADMSITDTDLADYIQTLQTMLSDPICYYTNHYTNRDIQDAKSRIIEIQHSSLFVTTIDEDEIRAEAFRAIEENKRVALLAINKYKEEAEIAINQTASFASQKVYPAFQNAEPKKTFEEVDGGITSTRFVDRCVHDGRLLTISKEYAHAKTQGKPKCIGGYGEVYPCEYDPDLEMYVVIKKIDYSGHQVKKDSAENEIIAARVMHWAIAPVLGMYEEHDTSYFLLPFLEEGDLHDAIQEDVKRIEEKKPVCMPMYYRLKILYQIASAIEYLHTEVNEFRGSIIHQDISSTNIVLDKEFNARLIDFGIIVEFKHGQTRLTHTPSRPRGKTAYRPNTTPKHVTKNNDWYGFGVVILEMLTGKEPDDGEKELKSEKDVKVDRILRTYRKEIKSIWGDEKANKELVTLALKCMKEKDIKEFEIVDCLEELVKKNGDNIRWSPPTDSFKKTRCVYCMVNPANNNVTDHDSTCNMYICVACLRNSYLNPLHCHTCRQQIFSPVGTKWGAILIAGNDVKDDVKDGAAGKTFSAEINKLQEVLISKHPMVNGISQENVCIIQPSDPGNKEDSLKGKVIEAFKKLAKEADESTIDTVMIYFSGHYTKEGFELGSKEDLFTKDDFKKELGNFIHIKTCYVFLDCCCAPDIAIPMLGKSIIQMNASTPLEDTNVTDGIGSPFTQMFMTALIGKTFNSSCKAKLQGMPFEDGKCETCETFFCEDGFITVEKMHSFISKHLKNNTPVLNCHGADSEAMKIGYFIESQTKMTFSMQQNNTSQKSWKGEFEIPDTLEHLKSLMLLPEFLEKMAVKGDSIPVDKYHDIVAVFVKTGTKDKYINELDTMEKLISAWNGKRRLYARLRGLDSIRHGRVGIFLENDVSAKEILEQYLKHSKTRALCVIKEETDNVKLEYTDETIGMLDDELDKIQFPDNQPNCQHLNFLKQIVYDLESKIDIKDATIVLEFPKIPPEYENVHQSFFLVKRQKVEYEGKEATV